MQAIGFVELLFPPSAKITKNTSWQCSGSFPAKEAWIQPPHSAFGLCSDMIPKVNTVPSNVPDVVPPAFFIIVFHYEGICYALWPNHSSLKCLQSSEGISIRPCGPVPASIMQEEIETFAVRVLYLLNAFEAGSFLYWLQISRGFPYEMLQTYVVPVCQCSTSFFGGKQHLDHIPSSCKAFPSGQPCIFRTIPNHQPKAPTKHLINDN